MIDAPIGEGSSALNQDPQRWKLFVDGSSGSGGSGTGLVLISLDHYKTSHPIRFDFKASNNEAEYEALIAGLHLARELVVKAIEVFSDSMLIVN